MFDAIKYVAASYHIHRTYIFQGFRILQMSYTYVCIINQLLQFTCKNIAYVCIQLLTECGVNIPDIGKRSLDSYHTIQHRRALNIPDVSLNQTLFEQLESAFILVRDNGILTGK